MSKWSKEEEAYRRGLSAALELVKRGSVELLEHEVQWRGQIPDMGIPMGVTSTLLIGIARKMIQPELHVLSTAMAYTLQFELKLPSRTIGKYLQVFNAKIDEYRSCSAKLDEDSKRLDYDYGINKQVMDWYNMATSRDESLKIEEDKK